jgi:hypothetical protein
MFRAERLNIHRHQVGGAGELNPDASNLPQVLDNFQFNSARYQRYIECFRRIFPHVYDIRVLFTRDNEKEIRAWMAPPATERTDLAFPLSDCGTGIGQVLAMLYVVINSSNPRTLIIDEPNSFLHPGAVRELIRILQENPRHQYIISTHSPAVVDVAKPSNLHILSWVDGQTKVTSTDAALVEAQRLVLKEVGASFADVFGAERVLWVEGKTEEVCFPRILAHFELLEARTAVVGVVNTGDFDGRGADRAILIYQRLSSGALMPESVSFLFDKEERSHQHQNDLRKLGKGRINFTNMRMFESYLISIPEIYLVFGRSLLEAGIDDAQITLAMVEVKLNEILGEASIANVNAPKVLERLFYDLSGGRLRYEKVKHGLALTEAILANNPDRLRPLATQIAAALHPNPL